MHTRVYVHPMTILLHLDNISDNNNKNNKNNTNTVSVIIIIKYQTCA